MYLFFSVYIHQTGGTVTLPCTGILRIRKDVVNTAKFERVYTPSCNSGAW